MLWYVTSPACCRLSRWSVPTHCGLRIPLISQEFGGDDNNNNDDVIIIDDDDDDDDVIIIDEEPTSGPDGGQSSGNQDDAIEDKVSVLALCPLLGNVSHLCVCLANTRKHATCHDACSCLLTGSHPLCLSSPCRTHQGTHPRRSPLVKSTVKGPGAPMMMR